MSRRPGHGALRAAGWLALLAAAGAGLRAQVPAAPAGPVVRLTYGDLRPGEPLLVFLEDDGTVVSARVSLLGRSAELRPAPGPSAGTSPKRVFAFMAIDVQAKPGSALLEVKIVRRGGRVEDVRRELAVAGRAFPSTKLTLDPNYVTPPASVQARIKRESELVALATSVVTPEWLGDGPFARPHGAPAWPNFGQRRLNNNVLQSLHTGLDLRVPLGEAIRAANAGTVVLASDLYLGGKTVIIDHGLGVFSSYGHMSELRVRRGEPVRKGATVGLCGSTGRSTGPHLHWSFKVLEARVDPEAMLKLPL